MSPGRTNGGRPGAGRQNGANLSEQYSDKQDKQTVETEQDSYGIMQDRCPDTNVWEKSPETTTLKVYGTQQRRLSGRHDANEDKEEVTQAREEEEEDQRNDG